MKDRIIFATWPLSVYLTRRHNQINDVKRNGGSPWTFKAFEYSEWDFVALHYQRLLLYIRPRLIENDGWDDDGESATCNSFSLLALWNASRWSLTTKKPLINSLEGERRKNVPESNLRSDRNGILFFPRLIMEILVSYSKGYFLIICANTHKKTN